MFVVKMRPSWIKMGPDPVTGVLAGRPADTEVLRERCRQDAQGGQGHPRLERGWESTACRASRRLRPPGRFSLLWSPRLRSPVFTAGGQSFPGRCRIFVCNQVSNKGETLKRPR